MYIDHVRLCVCLCVCVSLAAFPHYYTDQDVSWGNGRGKRNMSLTACTRCMPGLVFYPSLVSQCIPQVPVKSFVTDD